MTLDELEQRLAVDYYDLSTKDLIKLIDQINTLKATQERDNKL